MHAGRIGAGAEMSEPRKPFWGICGACSHCWPVCYVPMEAMQAAKLMLAARCPNCGAANGIRIAKQNDGVLQEETTGQGGAHDPPGKVAT